MVLGMCHYIPTISCYDLHFCCQICVFEIPGGNKKEECVCVCVCVCVRACVCMRKWAVKLEIFIEVGAIDKGDLIIG